MEQIIPFSVINRKGKWSRQGASLKASERRKKPKQIITLCHLLLQVV